MAMKKTGRDPLGSLLETAALLDAARAGDKAARRNLERRARGAMARVWTTTTTEPSDAKDLTEQQFEDLLVSHPLALRERLASAMDEVRRRAIAERSQDDAIHLLRLYRATGDLMSAKERLPLSPQLWAALDRLDQAFKAMATYKLRPGDFVSKAEMKRLRSAISSANAKKPRKHGLKRDGIATAAESSQRAIWAFLKANNYGVHGLRRGVGTGLVDDAMKTFGVSESKVRRAISSGKKGLLDEA